MCLPDRYSNVPPPTAEELKTDLVYAPGRAKAFGNIIASPWDKEYDSLRAELRPMIVPALMLRARDVGVPKAVLEPVLDKITDNSDIPAAKDEIIELIIKAQCWASDVVQIELARAQRMGYEHQLDPASAKHVLQWYTKPLSSAPPKPEARGANYVPLPHTGCCSCEPTTQKRNIENPNHAFRRAFDHYQSKV
jgi:hypothetical protein